jgi:hypothetical protein
MTRPARGENDRSRLLATAIVQKDRTRSLSRTFMVVIACATGTRQSGMDRPGERRGGHRQSLCPRLPDGLLDIGRHLEDGGATRREERFQTTRQVFAFREAIL